MGAVSRRQFLAGGVWAGAGAAAASWSKPAAAAEVKITSGTQLVTLGDTGIRTSVLGVGTGTRGGREQFELGQEKFTKLIRHAYDRGIRYIDTADMYRTHIFVGFAIRGLPREELFLQTKTMAKHPEVAKVDLERFRRELQTDYIDSLLMHCMRESSWPTDMRPVMDVLLTAKERGRVRALGMSCHGMDPLLAATECEWNRVNLVRINPFGHHMDGPPEQVAEQIRKLHGQGRGVIGMKIYGEGKCKTRQDRLESIKFILGLGCLQAFTIGFSKPEQIDETLELIREAARGQVNSAGD